MLRRATSRFCVAAGSVGAPASTSGADSALPTPPTPPPPAAVKSEVEQRITDINNGVLRPNDFFGHVSTATYATPMVMLLGNHSAGKSTFINTLLGSDEQQTGVAPTDDGFTVIRRGDVDMDEDGPSAVSNPHNQFQDLQSYGRSFVNHFCVKTRRLPAAATKLPPGMMIVDTPGMIDTPMHVNDRTTIAGQSRGYDFLGAVRWFAQRSDVILLMFDPSNPGTTGETLDVLTRSLEGFEHKFVILMNKVDVFEKVTDFARAYGALCWNLSKVIRNKDIPFIYTTYTPLPGIDRARLEKGAVPLPEMDRCRKEVTEKVMKAPLRRLDNLISEMEESAKRILLAAKVCTTLRRRFQARRFAAYTGAAAMCLGLPVGVSIVMFPVDLASIFATVLVSAGCVGGANLALHRHLNDFGVMLGRTIDSIVDEHYPGKERTSEVQQRWEHVVKPEIVEALSKKGIDKLPVLHWRAARKLEAIATEEVPDLRRKVMAYKEHVLKDL